MSKTTLGLLIRKLRKEKGFSYRGLEKEMKKMAIKLVMDESGDGVMGDIRQQEVQGMSDNELDELYKSLDKKDKNAISYVNIVHLENGRIETKRDVLVLLAKSLDYNEDALLAEGDKLGSDVEEIINKKSDVVPAFLRSTKHLTNEDWDELSKVVQKMNKKND
jgi:transcriptional regulator with XRE-family HTH domain